MPGARVKLTGMACVAHSDDLQLTEQCLHLPPALCHRHQLSQGLSPHEQMSLESRGQPTFLFKTLLVLSDSLLSWLAFMARSPAMKVQIIWLLPKGRLCVGGNQWFSCLVAKFSTGWGSFRSSLPSPMRCRPVDLVPAALTGTEAVLLRKARPK